ncbi:MAG: permease-like cell division protein FtsX [Rhodocyclaceae bacterium]|nr:permease-like cell division protein FtsX [Rhodocyclaceae bacterium]
MRVTSNPRLFQTQAFKETLAACLAQPGRWVWSALGLGLLLAVGFVFVRLWLVGAALTERLRETPVLTVMISPALERSHLEAWKKELAGNPAVARIDIVTREQTLMRYRQSPGHAEALALLVENPFADALLIALKTPDPALIETLREQWSRREGVLQVRAEVEWARALTVWRAAIQALASFLSLALALIFLAALMMATRLLIVAVGTVSSGPPAPMRNHLIWQGAFLGGVIGVLGAACHGVMAFFLEPHGKAIFSLFELDAWPRFAPLLELAFFALPVPLLAGLCALMARRAH